jgi:hypothetical protein
MCIYIYIYPSLVFICETGCVLLEEKAEAEEKNCDLSVIYKLNEIK